MECFRLLFDHLVWIKHQFLSSIRDIRKAGSLLGIMIGVGGVRKSIHRSWLAKGLGLGLQCWGFKRVQKEIPSGEASTLQIGLVAFPPGQYTSPHHHHNVVPPARISLILSRYSSQLFIASGRSSGLHPISSQSCCMHVRADCPVFVWPYEGVTPS